MCLRDSGAIEPHKMLLRPLSPKNIESLMKTLSEKRYSKQSKVVRETIDGLYCMRIITCLQEAHVKAFV